MLMMAIIKAARRGSVTAAASADRVIMDITVMLKAVASPTSRQLLEKSRWLLTRPQLSLRLIFDRATASLHPPFECVPLCGHWFAYRVAALSTTSNGSKRKLF